MFNRRNYTIKDAQIWQKDDLLKQLRHDSNLPTLSFAKFVSCIDISINDRVYQNHVYSFRNPHGIITNITSQGRRPWLKVTWSACP